MLMVEGERTMERLLDAGFTEGTPALSPDGRWMAYQSTESGNVEVFVRPFPDVDAGKWPVSNSGGFDPVWSPDGQELFFSAAGSFMVAQVETEPTFRMTTPERLFGLESLIGLQGREFDIAPDGDRFVFLAQGAATQTLDGAPFNGLVFVEHWFEELKDRVPIP